MKTESSLLRERQFEDNFEGLGDQHFANPYFLADEEDTVRYASDGMDFFETIEQQASQARTSLIESNLRLVISIAKRYIVHN